MNDNAQRPAGTDGDGRLDVEVLLNNALAGLIDILLGRFANRLDEIALLASERDLGADAQQSGQSHALQQRPGVVIDIIRQPGIAGGIGCGQIVDLDGGTIGQDDALPHQQGPRLAEGDDAVIGADQARALRDQQNLPGDAVMDVLGQSTQWNLSAPEELEKTSGAASCGPDTALAAPAGVRRPDCTDIRSS